LKQSIFSLDNNVQNNFSLPSHILGSQASSLILRLHFNYRYNARGFDLNRNFPDYFKQNNKRGQPETDAVKEWISKIQFVLSGGLHGGALVASYPFDNTPNSSKCHSTRCRYFSSQNNYCMTDTTKSFIRRQICVWFLG